MNLQLRYGTQPRIAGRWLRETWNSALRAMLSARASLISTTQRVSTSPRVRGSLRAMERTNARAQQSGIRYLASMAAWSRSNGAAGATWAGEAGKRGLVHAGRLNSALGTMLLSSAAASGAWLRRTSPDVLIAIDRANVACGKRTVQIGRLFGGATVGVAGVAGKAIEHIPAMRGRLLFGPVVATLMIESLLVARIWSQLTGSHVPAWVFNFSEPLVAPFARFDSVSAPASPGVFQYSTLLAFEVYLVTFIVIVALVFTLPAIWFAGRGIAKLMTPVPSGAYPRRTLPRRHVREAALTIDMRTIQPAHREERTVPLKESARPATTPKEEPVSVQR